MAPAISLGTKTYPSQKTMRIPRALLNNDVELLFQPVTPQVMPRLWKYLLLDEGRTCDFSYGGLVMWAPLFDYEYAISQDTLFIKGKLEGDMSKTAFSLPLGSMKLKEAVEMLKNWCDKRDEPLRFSAIPEHALDSFLALSPKHITPLRDWADYLYDIAPLATLSGKKMAKKRNHVNKFVSLYPDYEYRQLTKENISDAKDLLERIDSENEADSAMAQAERDLCTKTLEIFSTCDTPMRGGMLYVGGKPVAFTLGDIKGDTLFVHIEKADKEIQGAYEAINKFFAADMLANNQSLRYVNREDDAGSPGLRFAKESYHPVDLLQKYDIIL